MKRILLTTTCCIVLSVVANRVTAQTANLNITLSDVLSFTVSQPVSLDVNFDNASKYSNGITALATDHISVTSSRGFIVKAIAGTITGASSLSASAVELTSSIGASNAGNTTGITFQSAVTLPASGGSAATIITAANSSWNGANPTNTFNISYLIGSTGAFVGKTTGVNVIPVTYSVIQP